MPKRKGITILQESQVVAFSFAAPSVGVAAPAGLPVVLGAAITACLARDGRFAAVSALAEFPSALPLFLGTAPAVLPALLALVSFLVVLPAGHPAFLFGRRYILGRPAGGWPYRLLFGYGLDWSLYLVQVGLPAPLPPFPIEVDGVLKYLSFCMVHPRACGARGRDVRRMQLSKQSSDPRLNLRRRG